MEKSLRNEEVCPQLLDLISKEREWFVNRDGERRHGLPEEKKLELRLGPPGEDWSVKHNSKNNNQRERDESLLSLGYYSRMASRTHNNNSNGCQTQMFAASSENPWNSPSVYQHNQQQTKAPSFLQFPSTPNSLPVMSQETPQPCCTKVVDLQNAEKKGFSPSSAKTAVPNSSQKRYFSFSSLMYIVLFLVFWTEDIHSHRVTLLDVMWSMHNCFISLFLMHHRSNAFNYVHMFTVFIL